MLSDFRNCILFLIYFHMCVCTHMYVCILFLLNRLQRSFTFTAKLSRKYREFPSTPCSPSLYIHSPLYYWYSSPEWYICYNSQIYINTSLLLKVNSWVHSWHCTFDGFWQLCVDIYPSLYCDTGQFHCPKSSASSIHTSLLTNR